MVSTALYKDKDTAFKKSGQKERKKHERYLSSLAAHRAKHENYDIDYNDIIKSSEQINIIGDMLQVDLNKYDYIIATPPCNYYSIANYRREESKYSQDTKHLLPAILDKLRKLDKPYIVENVRNYPLFKKLNIYDKADHVYEIGRHTYWTNIPFNRSNIKYSPENVQNKSQKNRQGGEEVHNVIEYWLQVLTNKK